MTHEHAPQTLLVATSCCICSRPLCDAVSVETGIGPVCRKKHGYNIDCDEETRAVANQLVYRIAANQTGDTVINDVNALHALGFNVLANRISARLTNVTIEPIEGGYLVRTEGWVGDEVIAAWRTLPGRRWRSEYRANFVPEGSRHELWALLSAHFAGKVARGPKGVFAIG